MKLCDIAIIGAGPYGLSIAAHLAARGVDFRIFGSPMSTWLKHMPEGMRLKSEGFASCLYDPESAFTLEDYCREREIAYADSGLPVSLDTFTSYGLEFQRRFVPQLEDKQVVNLHRSSEGFQICLEDGEVLAARRVVMAVGLSHYEYVPSILASLPQDFVSHSARHRHLESFKGREVAVVGAGASALDLAALLREAGALVQVVARKPAIRFHDPPEEHPPSWIERMRMPRTGIGPGWKLFMCANAPLLFRQMPAQFRLKAVRRILGPAPGWFIKEQVVGKVPCNLGMTITRAEIVEGRVNLQLDDAKGERKTLITDHVIAATGYRVDIRRLTFARTNLLAEVRTVEHTPVLSSNFESSVPGLYFVGTSAANTFGPVLRFAFGAKFTAPRISRHLAKTDLRRRAPSESARKAQGIEESEPAGYVSSGRG